MENQISENDKFLLGLLKTIGKRVKWVILLFALAAIATISIQANKIDELNKTMEEMQLYIKELELEVYD